MNPNDDITIVSTDDWQAMYINDKLKLEGHSLYIVDVLEVLKRNLVTIGDVRSLWIDVEDLERFGNDMPDKLDKLKGLLKV